MHNPLIISGIIVFFAKLLADYIDAAYLSKL